MHHILRFEETLTFKSINETILWDHLNETCWAVPSCDTVYIVLCKVIQTLSNDKTLACDHWYESYRTAFSRNTVYRKLRKVVQGLSEDKTLLSDQWNESNWVVLSSVIVHYAIGGLNLQVCGQNPGASMKPLCVTTQMKATGGNFVWYCLLYKMVIRWFQFSRLWTIPGCVTNQMKATEQYLHVVQFTAPCKVVVDESMRCKMALTGFFFCGH